MMQNRASPFSLCHDWSVKWTNIQPIKQQNGILWSSQYDEKVLKALAYIGVIGGVQITRLFLNSDKKRLGKMVDTGKLVRHVIKRGNMEIPIYTPGINGARILKQMGIKYRVNSWLTYDVNSILKKLLFFQLYGKFSEQGEVSVLPAPAPYTGIIERNGSQYYIGIIRGNTQEFEQYFKWEKLTERIILVTESLRQLAPLNEYLKELKIRVTTDEDLKFDFEHLFYKWDGEWVKERKAEELLRV
ncbi:hypothetical protein L1765_11185 [Microaerobacter geothermalis]|uniref:hypothetical protein n=1 Tax=Microaerobacter geothermalis TaxID=674972 RepID=UPI001F2BD7B3|nr:hypothetical protein [Microaerobacter geothermalis]MCF6094526.1 hypothetical protein [Microaerobacter geothermalis]